MKEPVEINLKAPGYVVVAALVTFLIVGGFSLNPLLELFGKAG